MAISFRHDAAAVGVDPSGSTKPGRKLGETLVLQQQQNAQDNLQRSQDRLFEIGRMHLGNQLQVARDNRMVQADKDLLKARLDAQNEQFLKQREFDKQDMDAAIQRDMLQQSTRQVEGRVAEVRGMLNQNQYTPEGQKILGDLSGELRAIEAQRDQIRPKEYNALLHKWLDKAERAGLEKFVAKPPTVDDRMAGSFKDLGTGYGVFLQPDGKMDVREIDPRKIEDGKARASGGGRIAGDRKLLQMGATDMASDPEMLMKYREDAIDDLMTEWEKSNPDATGEAPEPTEQQIEDRTFELFERKKQEAIKAERFRQRMLQRAVAMEQGAAGGMAGQDAGQDAGQAERIQMPSWGELTSPEDNVAQEASRQLGQQGSGQAAASPGMLTPEESAARDEFMAMPIEERVTKLMPYHPDTKGRSLDELLNSPHAKEEYDRAVEQGMMEPGKYREYALEILDEQLKSDLGVFAQKKSFVGMNVNDIKDPQVKAVVDQLPRPKTEEEIQQIEGGYFVDPDNNLRMKTT